MHQLSRKFAPSPRTSLVIHVRVITALLIRNLMTRYGRENIGFVWFILEPMILTVGVMAMWGMIKAPYEHGVQIVAFVFSGYMPLTLWRHLSGAGIYILRMNKGLLYHRNVTRLDLIIAKFLLEFAGASAAFVTVYGILIALRLIEPLHDLGLILAGWGLMASLGFGAMFLFAAVTEMSEVAEKFIQPVQYLLVPLSGAFSLVEWLPTRLQELLLYVPLPHAYEAIRAGYFGPQIQTHYSFGYPLLWSLGMAVAGIWLLARVRDVH